MGAKKLKMHHMITDMIGVPNWKAVFWQCRAIICIMLL